MSDISRCVVNEAAGYLYVDMPKAACTSVKMAIAEHMGIDFSQTLRFPYQQLIKYAFLRNDLYRFSVVRDPFARAVSAWSDYLVPPYPRELTQIPQLRAMAGCTFDQFVRRIAEISDRYANRHFRSQASLLMYRGKYVIDEVFRVENIHASWLLLQDRFGIPRLQHLRPSKHGPIEDYFDDELRAIVRNRYRTDFDHFYPKTIMCAVCNGEMRFQFPMRTQVQDNTLAYYHESCWCGADGV